MIFLLGIATLGHCATRACLFNDILYGIFMIL